MSTDVFYYQSLNQSTNDDLLENWTYHHNFMKLCVALPLQTSLRVPDELLFNKENPYILDEIMGDINDSQYMKTYYHLPNNEVLTLVNEDNTWIIYHLKI